MGFWLAGLAGLLSAPAAAAAAPDWHLMGLGGNANERALFYFDRASLRTVGPDTREASVLIHLESPTQNGMWSYHAVRKTLLIDCANHTGQLLKASFLSSSGWRELLVEGRTAEANMAGTIGAQTEELACQGGIGQLTQVPNPAEDAHQRFVQRRVLVALPANVRWRRLGFVGTAPSRIAAFLEAGGPVADSQGRLLATVMLVGEDRGRPAFRFDTRIGIGCGTQDVALLYLREYDSSGSFVSEDVEQKVLPDSNGSYAALMSPLCLGDWKTLPEAQGFSHDVARNAFRAL